jgi:hypothetical protein
VAHGCEGRISGQTVKRRHGLDRCRYNGFVGMQLGWPVGLGIIADNIVNIARTVDAK